MSKPQKTSIQEGFVHFYARTNPNWVPFDPPDPDDYMRVSLSGVPLTEFSYKHAREMLVAVGQFIGTQGTFTRYEDPELQGAVRESHIANGYNPRAFEPDGVCSGDLFTIATPSGHVPGNPKQKVLNTRFCGVFYFEHSLVQSAPRDLYTLRVREDLWVWLLFDQHIEHHALFNLWKHQ